MKKRERLSLDGSIADALVTVSEGNPGALTAIMKLMQDPHGFFDVLHLDDMNMRGPQIWVAFKDVCNMDVALFREKIRSRNKEMIQQVNKEMAMDNDFGHRAVSSGAS